MLIQFCLFCLLPVGSEFRSVITNFFDVLVVDVHDL